ncbi:PHD finger protein 7 [Drosophila grimshawi]|uniref:GH12666 n=1 Tax=Drosophila grimshawi TaxID=7222 RepID=B4JKI1_DROGR|nr:PHD finger protein 7 [Drosophila grimshawi]EDW00084.1 GH12666 [Drosophila grimshawi]
MYKCDICQKKSSKNENDDEQDALLYGEWMRKQNVTVHYYCLLLSTNLPQRGGNATGILGFLLRDIRKEAAAAQQRKCAFCKETGASVICYMCRIVFHMACGLENRCISHFCDDFRSYCENCTQLDAYKRQLLADPPKGAHCAICFRVIYPFVLHNVAYGDCCRKGFAHRSCMRRYALASGYYLRCLWCRDKKFRDTIRLQSVFVPDRDATWERQQNAYRELHRTRLRCDMAECLCPNGRDYCRGTWSIQLCIMCAATGTHPKCRVGTMRLSLHSEVTDYKCRSCIEVEKKLDVLHIVQSPTADEHIDSSFYKTKRCCELSLAMDDDSPAQSDDDSTYNESIITVVASQNQIQIPMPQLSPQPQPQTPANQMPAQSETSVIELSDSEPSDSQQLRCALQTPLLLHESFTSGDHFYLVVYEYNEQLSDPCTGTCTLRFAQDDKRLKDRTEETLLQLQLTEVDIWFRDTNRGHYDRIDKYSIRK